MGHTKYNQMQDDQKLTGRGGAGRGQGRKDKKTKTTVAITLDDDLVDWYKTFGKLSPTVNNVLRNHKNHIEQMIAEADQLNERFQ
jgi:uncharacterized protein (DUF4415 family)